MNRHHPHAPPARCSGRAAAIVLGVLVTLAPLAAARGDATPRLPDGFDAGAPGRVAAVTDGDTLTLADGREVRLVGI